MNAYLKAKYGCWECSECGERYTIDEYSNGYTLRHIMSEDLVSCKNCGAIFTEIPKRCYWSEWYPTSSNGCSEQIKIGGEMFCARQTTARRQQLLAEGYYYNCECYKPKKE